MPRAKSFDPEDALGRAMELFWVRGFGATSISNLEVELGLGRVSLYGAFGPKKQLFLACLEKYRRDIALPLLKELDEVDGLAGIRRFFAQLTDASPALRRRGCFVVNTLVELSGTDPDIDGIVQEHLRFVEKTFLKAVKNGQKHRTIGRHVKARDAAHMLLTLAHGTFSLNRSEFGATLAQATVRTALRELLN